MGGLLFIVVPVCAFKKGAAALSNELSFAAPPFLAVTFRSSGTS